MRQQKINYWVRVLERHRNKKGYNSEIAVKQARQRIYELYNNLPHKPIKNKNADLERQTLVI